MAKNHVQAGQIMPWTNDSGSGVAAGEPVAVGGLVGVALDDIADGAVGQLAIADVWELTKNAEAVGQGVKLYLTSGGNITATATGNTPAGFAFAAAGAGDASCLVRLQAF